MAPPRRSARISAVAAQKALQEKRATGVKGPERSAQKSRVGKHQKSRTNPQGSQTRKQKAATTTTTKASRKKIEQLIEQVPGGTDIKLPTSVRPDSKASDDPDEPSTPQQTKTDRAQQTEVRSAPFPPLTPRRKNGAPDLDRPVDPHLSTATLLTPHGTHLTAYPGTSVDQTSPSKSGLPRPTATTGTILEQGLAHLVSVDPRLQRIIDKYPSPPWGPADLAEEVDPFRSLTSGIIGQQVSGAAAKSIKKKFITLFNKEKHEPDGGDNNEYDYNDSLNPRFPTPEEVAKCDIAALRTAGLSQRKAEYIKGLAEKFASGELSARMLLTASDEEVLSKLIAVRGLGRWSVEMFSCFGLKRLDVFSTGDLGVQRGMAAYMGRDVNKLKAKRGKFKYMSEKEMLEIAAPFSPYRSLFMWYMWRWSEVDISVMKD
ncbi:hypothetical protein VTO42DRAFT_3348 [Malbranchea cinnamomea]